MSRYDTIVMVGAVSCLLVLMACPRSIGWSNGGYSSDPANPDYGTHDWIAQHALDWLPMAEKKYIVDNLAVFLYGTELPDNDIASDGIGDRHLHHVYFRNDGGLQDDAAAVRALEEFSAAVSYLNASDFWLAAKTAGIMVGYISDVAVFGHVMGSGTDWGAEVHHSDYENYIRDKTASYASGTFDLDLEFDGALTHLDAYNATLDIASATTFGYRATKECVWMDANYDWYDPVFADSAGGVLNLAVNMVTDVLHTLAVMAGYEAVDNAAPIIRITSPVAGSYWQTVESTVILGGTASDDFGVTSVTWINAATSSSGVATGTTSWTATIGLVQGINQISVTAYDASGKSNKTSIYVVVEEDCGSAIISDPRDALIITLPIIIAIVVVILLFGYIILKGMKRKGNNRSSERERTQ